MSAKVLAGLLSLTVLFLLYNSLHRNAGCDKSAAARPERALVTGGDKAPRQPDCSARDNWVLAGDSVRAFHTRHQAKWRYMSSCCHFKSPKLDNTMRSFLKGPPGNEHYSLLGYLSHRFGDAGGALFAELGAREGASSFAMADNPKVAVFSFDIVDVQQHVASVIAFHEGKRPTPQQMVERHPNIHFVQAKIDADEPGNAGWRRLVLGSRVLLLDTFHFPETSPFEYDFMKFLEEQSFGGILLLDDININDEMRRFWEWCVKRYGPRAHDVTSVGHASGTGLIDFCGTTTFTP